MSKNYKLSSIAKERKRDDSGRFTSVKKTATLRGKKRPASSRKTGRV